MQMLEQRRTHQPGLVAVVQRRVHTGVLVQWVYLVRMGLHTVRVPK